MQLGRPQSLTSTLRRKTKLFAPLPGRTHREEASTDAISFGFVATIRRQRLNWLGQMLRKGPGIRLEEVATTVTLKEDGTCPEGSLFVDAPAHDDAARLCNLAGNEKGWAKHVRDAFPECAKATKTVKANVANATDDEDDDDDDDDDQAAPADKWTNGKLFHWDLFFGLTSGHHCLAAHMHRLACA